MDADFRVRSNSNGQTIGGFYNLGLRSYITLPQDFAIDLYANRRSPHMFNLQSSGDVLFQQASLQKTWGLNRVQGGLIRLPFGIYDYRETYASGIIDYPLARVDYALNGVDWGAPGGKFTTSIPKLSNLQIEVAGLSGDASGPWGNRNTLNGVVERIQIYQKDLIVGLSRWDGNLDVPLTGYGGGYSGSFSPVVARSPVRINGIDWRYTRPHLVVRGEYIFGTLAGNQTHGTYADVYYHLPKYDQITFVGRAEGFRAATGRAYRKQLTLGVRYTASPSWIFSMNWRINTDPGPNAYTWAPFTGNSGELWLQTMYKITR